MLKDSYQEFIDYFKIDKKDLYQFGISSIISADANVAKKQYDQKKYDLFNNKVLSIRGYGRGGVNTNLFLDLYCEIFGNTSIKKDPTNNAAPRANISSATGHRINGDIQNYQVSHIWGNTKNPLLFESVWNICFIPRLIDPFTGHECSGGWNDDFIPLLREFVYSKYEDLIIDYNDFVTSYDIQQQIHNYVDRLLSAGTIDGALIKRFEEDALSEWAPITRPKP